jgi:hypothetical protein
VTRIKNLQFSNPLSVYPNPTRGDLSIDFGLNYEEIDISVRNILGRLIIHNSYVEVNHISFNIEAVAGVYFIEVLANTGELEIFKIIKE